MRTAVCAAGIALLFSVTACKELLADIEEDFSYWASEPVITGFRSASPAQTSPAGVQCVPSASDAVITLTVRNPKNFSFIMPGTGAPADIVRFASGIHDASGTKAPEAGTDYTLSQSGQSTLTLTYKPAFLKRYEQSRANIGASITLYSTDGRKFNQTYSFDLEANTPPPDPAPVEASAANKIALFKTRTPEDGKHYYVLCFKVGGLPGENVSAGVPLHSDLTHVYVSKNGGTETAYPVTLNSGDFVITNPLNTAFIAKTDAAPLSNAEADALSGSPQPDTVPSGPWVLYLKTDVPVGGVTAKYGIRLFDGKFYSARAEQSIGKRTLPDPKVFAHTGMDNTANSGVYTEAGATNASGNNDLYPPNTAIYNGLSATNAIPVYSAYGEEVKLTIKKDDGNLYPAGVTVTGSVEKHSGDSVSGTASFTAGQSASVTLPSPTNGGGVAVYKVVFKATGEGFDDSTTRTLYYKVRREVKAVSSTLPMWHILKEAIAYTSADGTVVVNGEIKATKDPGNYGDITITQSLTIKKAVGASSAVISANRTVGGKQGHRIFNVEIGQTLTLENLTLQGGICPAGASGGGMYIKPGAGASLTDCRIIDCKSSLGNGGAVYTQGTLSLTRGSIGGTGPQEGNEARYGGGIYVAGGSCTLTGTEVAKNYADGGTSSLSEGKGGGIYVAQGGTCSLYNVDDMKNNMVKNGSPNTGAGAGIYVESGGTFNIAGSTKIDKANDVYLEKNADVPYVPSKNAKITVNGELTGTHIVARITPEDYTAGVTAVNAASGVDISAYANRFKITDQNPMTPWKLIHNGTDLILKQVTAVIPNTATWKILKEAIEASSVEDGDEFLVQSTITATSATDDHGAISVTKKITVKGAGSTPTLDASSLSRIFTVENGGKLTLENLTLKNGKADGTQDADKWGGGILVKAGCKAELKSCIIKNCEAKEAGGGICVGTEDNTDDNIGTLTMTGGEISGNTADAGGGIAVLHGTFTMSNGKVSGNTATQKGGGIFGSNLNKAKGKIIVSGGEISGNTAKAGGVNAGGGICSLYKLTVSGGNIKDNAATAGFGGGIGVKGTFDFSGGTVSGNTAYSSSTTPARGTGIFSENSAAKLEMSGNARVANDNDIYLPAGRMITVEGSLTNNPAARITVPDDKYLTSTQVLDGSAVGSNYTKFTVTPDVKEDGIAQTWTIDSTGKLEKSIMEVRYDKLEYYLKTSSHAVVENGIYRFKIIGNIPPEDLRSKVFKTMGKLAQTIQNSHKNVALILPDSIPGLGGMYQCFYGCEYLVSLENIPSGVTSIQECFKGCKNLTKAPVIPSSVTDMEHCFDGCTALTEAPDIPSGVTNIKYCFQDCKALIRTPVIPQGVTDIYSCFQGCTKLTQVSNIPSSVTDMGQCFKYCVALTQGPDIPSNVDNMYECFEGCTNLIGVKLNCNYNDEYTYFTHVFKDCSNLNNGGIKVPHLQLQAYQDHADKMKTTREKFSEFFN